METENKGMALLKQEMPNLKALIGLNAKVGVNTEILAMQELEYLKMHVISKPDILNCEPITIVQAVKAMIKNNLSFDPSAGLVYITTRGVNKGTYQKPEWIKVLECTPTANGSLSINYQCGKLIDHKNPEVKKSGTSGQVIEVSFEYQNARGRWEKKTWDESDFERWKLASHKQNARGWNQASGKPQPDAIKMNCANPLYSSFKGGIDPEFARAKAVKHGLKKLGTNPNEVRMDGIVIQEPKRVQIEQGIENAVHEEEIYEAVVIESPSQKIAKINELTSKIPTANEL